MNDRLRHTIWLHAKAAHHSQGPSKRAKRLSRPDSPDRAAFVAIVGERATGFSEINPEELWDTTQEEIEARWSESRVDLVEGEAVLGGLWSLHGLVYDKTHDGVRIAEQMRLTGEDKNLAALDAFMERVLGTT